MASLVGVIVLFYLLIKGIGKLVNTLVPILIRIFIKVPIGLLKILFGLAECTTLLLIPVGYKTIKNGVLMIVK